MGGGTYDDDVAGADDEGVDVPRPGPAWGGPHGLGEQGDAGEQDGAYGEEDEEEVRQGGQQAE